MRRWSPFFNFLSGKCLKSQKYNYCFIWHLGSPWMTPVGVKMGVYMHEHICASTPTMSVKPLESMLTTSMQMHSQLTKWRPTDLLTNQPTNRQTDHRVRYRVTRSRLKINTDVAENNVGLTAESFKLWFENHKKSFKYEHYSTDSTLSSYTLNLKIENINCDINS